MPLGTLISIAHIHENLMITKTEDEMGTVMVEKFRIVHPE